MLLLGDCISVVGSKTVQPLDTFTP